MKVFFSILLFLTLNNSVLSQQYCDYCFDADTNCSQGGWGYSEFVLKIDTVLNPNNIWQIGSPQKTNLNSAWSPQNVIITDTINSYPISDTSIFTIENSSIYPSSSISWAHFSIEFGYSVLSDTIVDFGLIEFSPDNGASWIDLINNPFYQSYLDWGGNSNSGPVLSGNSNGWKYTGLNMRDLGLFLDIQPGTIFKWRFTFISDGNQTNKDGLMFDNISIDISPPIGLQDLAHNFSPRLTAYPNPFAETSIIQLEQPIKNGTIEVRNLTGALYLSEPFNGISKQIDLSQAEAGTYLCAVKEEGVTIDVIKLVVNK